MVDDFIMSLWDNVQKDDTLAGIQIALNVMANTLSEFMNATDERLERIEQKVGEVWSKINIVQPALNCPPPPPLLIKPPPPPKPKPYNLRETIVDELAELFKKKGKSE